MDSGITFEQFKDLYLRDDDPIASLFLADDELETYELYKRNQIITPRLAYGAGTYETSYAPLRAWFEERFMQALAARMEAIHGFVDTNAMETVAMDLFDFRQRMSQMNEVVHGSTSLAVGTDEERTIMVVNKAFRSLDLGEDGSRILQVMESTGRVFSPGSAMFLLELYAQLRNGELIGLVQDIIGDIDEDRCGELMVQPILTLDPWSHQRHALGAWIGNQHTGLIEMATATGKTVVGMLAIEHLHKKQRKAMVRILAHSNAILDQWRKEVIVKMGLSVDPDVDFRTPIIIGAFEIYFHTVQSIIGRPQFKPGSYGCDLMIIDEVHHIGGPQFRKAMEVGAKWRMGLSATIEGESRSSILKKGMGDIVYSLSVQDAIEKGILPEFEWHVETVNLSLEEEEEFAEISDKIRKLFNMVRGDRRTIGRIADEKTRIFDIHDFIHLMEKARYEGIDVPHDWTLLQSLILKRRWIIHRSNPRLEASIKLAAAMGRHKKVIIFTMDIESCDMIADELRPMVENVFVAHSRVKEPLKNIDAFKRASEGVLIGARMMDEGIDIPDAEIGINVASTKTRLQLVQRLGRILRKKEGKGTPLFYHYVAIPNRRYFLGEEDSLMYLDDLNWVQETALKLGMRVKMGEFPYEELVEESEYYLQQKFDVDEDPVIPGIGVFEPSSIVSSFSDDQRESILDQLAGMQYQEELDDTSWMDIIRHAMGKQRGDELAIPGIWWLLVAANRDPKRLEGLFEM